MKQTIFKKDSKGKLRFLTVEAENGWLTQISGLVGGKSVTYSKEMKPKNMGRSNETTKEEQADLEMASLITKKLKLDYFSSKEEALESNNVLYMGAKNWEDEKHKIKEEISLFISRKYDGMRCLAHVVQGKSVKLMSRQNTDILEKHKSMMHLIPQLINLPSGVYDGELFNMEIGSFQEQMKAIKKYRPGVSEKIDFNVYDMYHETDPYSERYNTFFINIVNNDCGLNVKIVPQIAFMHKKDITVTTDYIKNLHDKYISEGYEGAIVRVNPNYYECNKKSSQMLKVKQFFDIAAQIIDIVPQEADPSKGQVVAKTLESVADVKKGTVFNSGMAVSHKEQAYMMSNKDEYIGKTGEFRFFEATDDGDLRHAHYHGLRLDK